LSTVIVDWAFVMEVGNLHLVAPIETDGGRNEEKIISHVFSTARLGKPYQPWVQDSVPQNGHSGAEKTLFDGKILGK
jgi:hypothetical protein